jgi:hypothetical protein
MKKRNDRGFRVKKTAMISKLDQIKEPLTGERKY